VLHPPPVPIVFAVPLISRAIAHDWTAVQNYLRQTLATVLSSDDPDVLIVVAHADKPIGDYWTSERVVSLHTDLPVLSSIREGRNDKNMKRTLIGVWLRRHCPRAEHGAYVVFLDADDLVSRQLVPFVRALHRTHGGCGVRLDRGWLLDEASRRASAVEDGFTGLSGSSFAGYFAAADLPHDLADEASAYRQVVDQGHSGCADSYHATTGRVVIDADFPATAYRVNHTESLYQRLTDQADRSVGAAQALTPAQTCALLHRDFPGLQLPG
jgi:hypothetical protein